MQLGCANYRWVPLKSGCSLLLSEILRFPAPFKLKGNPASHTVCGLLQAHRSQELELRGDKGGSKHWREMVHCGSWDGLEVAVLPCHYFIQGT